MTHLKLCGVRGLGGVVDFQEEIERLLEYITQLLLDGDEFPGFGHYTRNKR